MVGHALGFNSITLTRTGQVGRVGPVRAEWAEPSRAQQGRVGPVRAEWGWGGVGSVGPVRAE